jgi:hypothetical protein
MVVLGVLGEAVKGSQDMTRSGDTEFEGSLEPGWRKDEISY